VEKVISGFKILYLVLLVVGATLLGIQIYKSTVAPFYYPPTFSDWVSVIILLVLMFTAYTSVFTVIIGILRKVTARGNADKNRASNKLISKGIMWFALAFFTWVAVNLYTAFVGVDIM